MITEKGAKGGYSEGLSDECAGVAGGASTFTAGGADGACVAGVAGGASNILLAELTERVCAVG